MTVELATRDRKANADIVARKTCNSLPYRRPERHESSQKLKLVGAKFCGVNDRRGEMQLQGRAVTIVNKARFASGAHHPFPSSTNAKTHVIESRRTQPHMREEGMAKNNHIGKFKLKGVENEFIAMLNVLELKCRHTTTE